MATLLTNIWKNPMMTDEPPKKKPKNKGHANIRTAPQWKKGQSGNPKGKPKGTRNRATIMKELLELNMKTKTGGNMANPLDPSESSITIEKAVMVALIKKALKGDVRAIQEVQDTKYGKLKEKTEIVQKPLHLDIDDKNITQEQAMQMVQDIIANKI